MAQSDFGSDKYQVDRKIGDGCPFSIKIGGISACNHAGPGCKIAGWEMNCGEPDIKNGFTLSMRILILAQSWFKD